MPLKGLSPKERRTVLKPLFRDRLGELTTHFGLEVADRRSTDAHVDAILRKRSLAFQSALEELSRDELKAISHALGHGSTGRDKASFIDRILGVAPAAEAAEPSEPGASNDDTDAGPAKPAPPS